MSTGGLFNLITNDGKQDSMLMSTPLLSKRIEMIRQARAGMKNPNPTLKDIQKTHILFMNAQFKPFAAFGYEYNKVTANNPTLGSKVQFSIPQFGDFFSDMAVHVVVEPPTATFTGTASNADADCAVYRFCDYPGERLFQRVAFVVNGNPLDEYFPEVYNMHRQFRVPASKLTGWNKCMGQETAQTALFKYHDDTTAPTAPKECRAAFQYFDGHQTYKKSHSALEMVIPLLFWFNTDPRLAIPSVAIPYGQRFINIDLATPQQLVRAIINPGALSTSNLSAPVVTTPVISKFDLYINNIFVQPDIHDIFIARIGFTLVRVHLRFGVTVNKANDSLLLNNIRWPVETLYIGVRPTANVTTNAVVSSVNNQNSVTDPNMSDWHKFGVVNNANLSATSATGINTGFLVSKQSSHITELSITAHGIPLYNALPSKFFNCYVPYQFGGWDVSTPVDNGLYMVNFCLYPGTYQPSGHINVSRAREFYLAFKSTYVQSDRTADLIVNAVAINFLLISDGSATLRYAT